MSTKHTPGPWNVGDYDPENPSIELAVVTENHTVCLLDQSYFDTALSEQETLANACLIAAAPDLLEAIELLLQYAIDVDDTGLTKGFRAEKNTWIKAALAAIAKAEGRE